MPKSSSINNPASTISCDTLESLRAEYQKAVREFTEGAQKYRNTKRIPATQLDLIEHANLKAEAARRAVRNHMIEHGCG
jgi:hypothetical protein